MSQFICRSVRAARPALSARTASSTDGTRPGAAQPPASSACATVSTSAEPTTAASATRAISAACAGVLMPKPAATGSAEWRFKRATAAATLSIAADFVPVMPAIAT